jgi:hypothetical protein
MIISVKTLLQIAVYSVIIAALVVINFNQLSLSKAYDQAPISAPITSPEVTPEPTVTPTPEDHHDNGGSNDNHSDGGSNGGNSGPSVCGDQKPGTPTLLNVIKTGPNQVTLFWNKPVGPVSGYVLAYGLTPAKMLYGDPNIGNVNSYTVKYLQANTAYYFRVRAANGCQPGDFSNPLGISAYGKALGQTYSANVPAAGFKSNVLGSNKNTYVAPKNNPTQTQNNPQPQPSVFNLPKVDMSQTVGNIFGQVLHFLYR